MLFVPVHRRECTHAILHGAGKAAIGTSMVLLLNRFRVARAHSCSIFGNAGLYRKLLTPRSRALLAGEFNAARKCTCEVDVTRPRSSSIPWTADHRARGSTRSQCRAVVPPRRAHRHEAEGVARGQGHILLQGGRPGAAAEPGHQAGGGGARQQHPGRGEALSFASSNGALQSWPASTMIVWLRTANAFLNRH